MKRVYHPSANAWKDVEDGAVAGWAKAGWKVNKPSHIDDSAALALGDFYSPTAATPSVASEAGGPAESVESDAPAAESAKDSKKS